MRCRHMSLWRTLTQWRHMNEADKRTDATKPLRTLSQPLELSAHVGIDDLALSNSRLSDSVYDGWAASTSLTLNSWNWISNEFS